MSDRDDDAGPAQVTVVTAAACHFCEDALEVLTGLGRAYPLTVEELPAASPAGQALLGRHGVGVFPLVLVDGEFFSAGRLPRHKLLRLLAIRQAAAAGVAVR